MGELLRQTMQTTRTVGISLAAACDRQIILNHKEYPVKGSDRRHQFGSCLRSTVSCEDVQGTVSVIKILR